MGRGKDEEGWGGGKGRLTFDSEHIKAFRH